MKILFLDQSGELGGAELCLLDIAREYRDRALVVLFADGPFRLRLEQQHIPVQVVTAAKLPVRKQSGLWQGLWSILRLIPAIHQTAKLSRAYDVIYANTQKAFVVGAIASVLSHRPLVYHLHDILSLEHFSRTNLWIAVTLANRFASLVIANSHAARQALLQAGGNPARLAVVYNGFNPDLYLQAPKQRTQLRQQLGLEHHFVVGHFSRLSPWKGQHVLLEALRYCPEHIVAVFVGDALFGEQDYVAQLHRQIEQQGLQHRVRFLGFQPNVPPLMAMCDLVTHTSTAPEPFGRVIVEAMLCGTPVIATAAGGAIELIEPEQTGWLAPVQDPVSLATLIQQCDSQPELTQNISALAQQQAAIKFDQKLIQYQIKQLINKIY